MKQLLHQLMLILSGKQKKGLVLLFFGALFIALLDTLAVGLMSPFMTMLANMDGANSGDIGGAIMTGVFGKRPITEMLAILSALIIGLYLFRGACKVFYNYWQARLMANYRTDLSTRLFSYVLHKPYAFHLNHNTAETQRLVSGDVENCFTLITHLMLTVSSALVSLGIFALLLVMNWKFTLIMLVLVGLFMFLSKKYLKSFIQRLANMSFEASSDMNKWVSQAIGGLKNILVKRKQDYYVTHYGEAAQNAAIASSNYTAVDSIPKVLIDTLCMVMVFSVVLVQLLIGNSVMSALPMFATFAVAAFRLIPVIGQVTAMVNTAAYYCPSVDAIYDVISTGEVEEKAYLSIEKKEAAQDACGSGTELTDGVELSHISFRYKDAERDLFSDLSIKIPARKSVAFVGVTGSGKTTLADIILGLHEPTGGQILVDGLDIRQNPAKWAGMIGYIPQFIHLCDDSIRANVAMGDEAAAIDDEWVWSCLERAQMKEFVKAMPKGLDSMIGENGIRLSGGQRQRIGIARALYFKPQFLLMDEATSALDNDTEKAIVDSINMLSGDLTLLIIAHRVSTIEECDMIFRIEDGKAETVR